MNTEELAKKVSEIEDAYGAAFMSEADRDALVEAAARLRVLAEDAEARKEREAGLAMEAVGRAYVVIASVQQEST